MSEGLSRTRPSNVLLAKHGDEELLRRVHDDGDPAAREELVRRGIMLVHHIAHRFARRGVEHDELVQVGSIGLVNAIDRFDPARGVKFSSFAVPHIAGEMQRYFRDHAGQIRITRRIQENLVQVNACVEELTLSLQRSPRIDEIVSWTGLSAEEVLDAVGSRQHRRLQSLDEPVAGRGDDQTHGDLVASREPGFDQVDARLTVEPVIERLQERDRRALDLRFRHGLTQREIAENLGVSQMEVSRTLSRVLGVMREGLADKQSVATG